MRSSSRDSVYLLLPAAARRRSFPARGRPKIIWIGVGRGHPHLFQLHKRVTDAALAAGIEADLRPWRPHVTLARCEQVSAESIRPFLRAEGDFDAGLVPIDSFELKSSLLTPSGSIYATELSSQARVSRGAFGRPQKIRRFRRGWVTDLGYKLRHDRQREVISIPARIADQEIISI